MFIPWKKFTDKVRVLLTVDGVRKGSFTQKYIDQVIKAGVLDLQSFIPSLKPHFSHTYEYDDFTHTTDESSVEFASPATNITSVHVIRTTGVESRARITYDEYQQKLPTTRIDDFPNASFRSCSFEVRPPLVSITTTDGVTSSEKVMLRYISEVSDFEEPDLVPFDDRCAKLVANYVKAHVSREIDKDLQLYSSYMLDYAKDRSIYHLDRAEYTPECMDDTQIIKYNSTTMSTNAETATAAENLSANDLVTFTPTGALKAQASAGYSADGYVKTAVASGASAAVFLEGVLPGEGYVAGTRYYLSETPGLVTTISPSTGISQFIGKALSDTEINFEPDQPVRL